jgi:hypothetical protein
MRIKLIKGCFTVFKLKADHIGIKCVNTVMHECLRIRSQDLQPNNEAVAEISNALT